MRLLEILKIVDRTTDVQKTFMKEWVSMSMPHPLDDRQRLMDGVSFTLRPFLDDSISLDLVVSYDTKGAGKGTAAMKKILALADKHQLSIVGSVLAKPHMGARNMKSMNNRQLHTWYKKLGFKRGHNHTIVYTPK